MDNQVINPTFPVWDVYLSFYGNDTATNFTASLYFALDQAGILTYRDDPQLRQGQDAANIRDSKKFIVVLSENYACSPCCLDELVEILSSCNINNNQIIIPIFYYVSPLDVRYQTRSFGTAFEGHDRRYSVDTVNQWRSALAQIADLSGYQLNKYANQYCSCYDFLLIFFAPNKKY